MANFADLIGKTLVSMTGNPGDDEITFYCTDGSAFKLYHSQDCCETVEVESITGDPADLIGSPVTLAEESTSDTNPPGVPVPEYQDSFTWTFYKFATRKGYVDVRWYGESNGYYSESVDFAEA